MQVARRSCLQAHVIRFHGICNRCLPMAIGASWSMSRQEASTAAECGMEASAKECGVPVARDAICRSLPRSLRRNQSDQADALTC